MSENQRKETFKSFLATNKVLIVDKSSTSRSRLKACIVKMGANPADVFTSSSKNDAFRVIQEHQPSLVFSDYIIENGSGFDLFKDYKSTYPDLKKVICILITSDMAQSLVARAAEEDVDSFLVKPYTLNSIEKNLTNTIMEKLYPSKYMATVLEAKELIAQGDFNKADEKLELAISLSKGAPALAHYYKGQVKLLQDMISESQMDFKEGLKTNKIHFKCQIGLYKSLMKQTRYFDAYDVLKTISRFFPANAQRIADIVRLCVVTESYHDMLDYYNLYLRLDERPEDLKKHIRAGMFVSGKYYLLEKNEEGAQLIFNRIAISFTIDAKFVTQCLNMLIDFGCLSIARPLFKKFPLGTSKGDFESFDFILNHGDLTTSKALLKGEFIFTHVKSDIRVGRIMLDLYRKEENEQKYNEFLNRLTSLFPSENFDTFTKKAS
ncbi:MAG: response regulator [Bacteriovoracaceae bacterium]|nr:response regulator [Bacteriovoracaceae bacterium]